MRYWLAALLLVVGTAWATEPTPSPQPQSGAYDRDEWPHWTDDDNNHIDARTEVLIRDSLIPPRTFTNRAGKVEVSEGLWVCPYTGQIMTDPRQLDVDHMVPLKFAYTHGAQGWTREQREQYANWLQNPNHLKAVSATSNRSKGDKGPGAWKPPLKEAWCEYAIAFGTVAHSWGLQLDKSDEDAIVEMIATCPLPSRWDLRQ